MRLLALVLMCWALPAGAVERVSVCYNYGCLAQSVVEISDERLVEVGRLLHETTDAEGERAAIARIVGHMLGWAAEQTPIGADRGGNYADEGVYGRMDCVDHSTTTTRLLRMIEAKGMLRFHHVLDPVLRRRFLLFEHYSALIEERKPGASDCGCDGEIEADPSKQFVVDSWFFDNGQAAAVMPLARWKSGESPGESPNENE